MPQLLNVYALPKYVEPEELAGGTVVVIDVLRASSTIIHALEAGAREVIPCLEVEEARRVARQFPAGEVLLGGERNGVRIGGFDLGNSPEEYSAAAVAGKTIVFTTTNGTRALFHARQAERILIGGFVNATAVFEQLLGQERVHLLCAGTRGDFGPDDVLLAGMLVERLLRLGGMVYQPNAQAATAREFWLNSFALPQALGAEPLEPERLAEKLYESPGGQHLAALGLDEDILAAAQLDAGRAVPRFDPPSGRITA